jgi:hypothetical protein
MKRFTKFVVESIEEADLNEAVEVRHDRYLRSHGKKARDTIGGSGTWAFTHKDRGDVDYNNDKEIYKHSGKFSDAKKAAQQWGKKHGHREVYVMESVELDEVSDKMLDRYRQKAFADQPSGDDGSDKYRKRKFGRDLAFAKQTGRAKVLATKEEVELDEVSASTLRSYVDKAKEDKTRQQKARTVAKSDAKKYGLASDKERADAAHRKVGQRGTGISIAQKKLGMYPKDRAQPKVMAREETEIVEAVTVKKKDYSWGKMMTVHHGSSHSFPLHPEHQTQIKKLNDGEKTMFKDETGSNITAHREGDKIHLKHPKVNQKTTISRGHFTESVNLDEKKEKMNENVNDLVRVGQKMLELAPKEKNDMISNAYSRLGDALTRYGTPFGPKNVADLEKKTGMNQRIIMSLIKKVQQ